MDIIVSKTNPKVKYIKSLNEKKNRLKYNSYYLEGIKVVNEILDLKEAIDIVFIAYSKTILENLNGGRQILDRIDKFRNDKNTNIEFVELSDKVLEYVTDTITPQGILAVLKIPKYEVEDVIIDNKSSNILILDKVQDLGNIGTIIRSANAFLVNTIICINGTADVYSPKVLRATMAAILRQKIVYVAGNNIEPVFETIKKSGKKVIGTSLDTNRYINEIDLNGKYAFVVGNEANGVSNEILEMCDEIVKIPMSNTAESLNVGVATGIILYEAFKNK